MTEALRKFADELKSLRESKEVTLNFIAHRTKIDIKYLQAIENGNFDALPEIYIRAFIKEYAQVIGLNELEVIKKFDQAKKGIIEEEKTPNAQEPLKETEIEQSREVNTHKEFEKSFDSEGSSQITVTKEIDKQTVKPNYYILALAALVVVLILSYFLFLKEPSVEIINDNLNEEADTNNQSRYEIKEETSSATSNMVVDSLNLTLSSSGRVWLKVVKDNKEVYQGFLEPQQSKNFTAKNEFRVVAGNAGLVAFQLNGKPIKVIGNKGEIRNYVIKADTVISYLISVPSKNENKSSKKN